MAVRPLASAPRCRGAAHHGVAEGVAGDWSNGQVVSPKAELDMGSRQRTRDGTELPDLTLLCLKQIPKAMQGRRAPSLPPLN
nr:unnamed protein product [Digitaria exilis]